MITETEHGRKVADLGDGLEVWVYEIAHLREQEINAQVMAPRDFDRLVENVRTRGQLESMPYCFMPEDGSTPMEIISGHHRSRAARAAGLDAIPVLVDRVSMSRSEIAAKQIAHNQLHGEQDTNVLRELLKQVTTADDLLATGLPEDMLPAMAEDPTLLATPHADFEWRTISFTFLPHQMKRFEEVLNNLDGRQDLVGVARIESYEPFVKAASQYMRIRCIRTIGSAVDQLTRLAEVEMRELDDGKVDERADWVPILDIVGSGRLPPDVAKLLGQLADRLEESGDITADARWRAIELAVAELAGGLP